MMFDGWLNQGASPSGESIQNSTGYPRITVHCPLGVQFSKASLGESDEPAFTQDFSTWQSKGKLETFQIFKCLLEIIIGLRESWKTTQCISNFYTAFFKLYIIQNNDIYFDRTRNQIRRIVYNKISAGIFLQRYTLDF